MKANLKSIIYSVNIMGWGTAGLLLNESIFWSSLSKFMLILVLICIYFDKDYRLKFIPKHSNRAILFGISIILIILLYSIITSK